MKQIIDGKLYDTEKCKFIAEFVLHEENFEIYKTPKGSYIGYKPVEKMIIDQPRTKMIIGYADADLYIKLYGDVEEG